LNPIPRYSITVEPTSGNADDLEIVMSHGQQSGCACCGTAADRTNPDGLADPAVRVRFLAGAEATDARLVCTLDGGLDAMRGRIGEWRAIIAQATGREPADGGVTLVYDHDPAVTVELARLAAAEFACCSFFTFTLIVATDGMRFTISAPDEARDVVTAVFGAAAPAPVGATPAPAGGTRVGAVA
jgi:hypothetical protein